MLAVSGGLDMRTPLPGARAVTAQFPHGQLLIVPSTGHSTVTADVSGCAIQSVRAWIQGGAVPAACPAEKPFVLPVSNLPAPGKAKPKKAAAARATYAIAVQTIHDAEAMWLLTSGESGQAQSVAGVYGGRMNGTGHGFKLVNYTLARGVTVSGSVKYTDVGPPIKWQGTVTVGGAGAAHGLLGLSGSSIRGSLGGRPVG
jgi:hypothetical protein